MRPSRRQPLPISLVVAVVAAVVAVACQPIGATPVPSASPTGGAPSAGGAPIVAEPWADVTWQELPQPFPDADATRIDGVVSAGPLLIGWGRAAARDRDHSADIGAVFVSADGRAWRTILLDHGVGPGETSEPVGIAFGPRGFLAFGGVCCEVEARAIWRSEDGERWSRVLIEGDLDPRAFWFSDVIGTDDGWLAAGTSFDGTGRLYHSGDGSAWEAIDADADGGAFGALADLARGPDGLLAVGTVDASDGTHDGGIWRSTDGRTWDRLAGNDPVLAGEGETELYRIVSWAGGLFVVGNHGSSEERRRCEELIGMVGSTDLSPPERVTAFSCGWGTDHYWLSTDGLRWERVDPGDLDGVHPIEFRIVAAGGRGLLVLGEGSGQASPDTMLFGSDDGLRWEPLGAEQALLPTVAMGLAVDGSRLLAVAEHWDGSASTFRGWLGTAEQ